jgi:hypothetical protein
MRGKPTHISPTALQHTRPRSRSVPAALPGAQVVPDCPRDRPETPWWLWVATPQETDKGRKKSRSVSPRPSPKIDKW